MNPTQRAEVLIEALPYMRQFYGQTIVVKYGGSAMSDETMKAQVMVDLSLLHYVGIRPILVHGGGPEINDLMKRLNHEPAFVNGLRVTDDEGIEIVEMALAGKINKNLVALLNKQGTKAVGVSGKDANLLVATKLDTSEGDLGHVGEIVQINAGFLSMLSDQGYVPVVCSVAIGQDGETYNINADHAAGAVAAAMKATKLIVLTDVEGVYENFEDKSSLIHEMDVKQAADLVTSGKAGKGMIPKLEACIAAVQSGVERAHLIDGREPHSMLIEIFTASGIGTMIKPTPPRKNAFETDYFEEIAR